MLKSLEELPNWIETVNKDPIAKILLENSHLTKVQLETYLINLISDYLSDKTIKTKNKVLYRKKRHISRGSYNLSLKQAKNNIIRSAYTVILLSYLNITDSTSIILRCLDISNKVREYVNLHKESAEFEREDIISSLEYARKELERILVEFSSRKICDM